MSVFSPTPVYIVIITTLVTMMPGSRYCRYSRVEPASAPPKRYVNISVMMIGKAVTSNSCSGTCLIFSIARQPNVTDADQALGRGGRAPGARTAPSVSGEGTYTVCWSVDDVAVLIGRSPP